MSDCVGPALICCDGSDHADRAIRHAGVLLGQRDAVVMHVPNRRSRSGVVQAGRRRALETGSDPVETVEARHGPLPMAILNEAHARHASVIVVATHGRSPVQPGRLGSVSSALVRLSETPVLGVGPRVASAVGSEPIFVCYDGSTVARRALDAAASLLAGREAMTRPCCARPYRGRSPLRRRTDLRGSIGRRAKVPRSVRPTGSALRRRPV